MKIKGIIFEDFVNYKQPSMNIMFPYCSFKCDKECGEPVCQNSNLAHELDYDIDIDYIVSSYINNPITEAIVFQGLEPLDSYEDLVSLIAAFRKVGCNDKIIIYTGYTICEIREQIDEISKYSNIIVKFGRFIPNQNKHLDPVLGVYLSSDNQYAKEFNCDKET